MVPVPLALGLTLCHNVLVEEGTRNVSLIGSFVSVRARTFPHTLVPYCVFATLIGGQGQGRAELTLTRLLTDEEVFALSGGLVFPDRFTEVRVLFRLQNCRLPAPGGYMFNLLVDGELVAHRRLRVSKIEVPE